MKKHKYLIFSILILLLTVVLIFLISGDDLKNYRHLQEAGYQTLTPINHKTVSSEQHMRGRTVTSQHYYVQFRGTIEGKDYKFWLSSSETYGENDLSTVLDAIRDKRIVQGYLYYTEDAEKIYFSKTAATAKEYVKQETMNIFMIAAAVDLFVILPMFLSWLIGKSRLPEEAERIFETEEPVVCRYSTYTYAMLLEICLILTVLSMGMICYSLMEWQLIYFMVFGILAALFLALSVAIFLYMKNWVLLLSSKGLIFRNLSGKVYCCSADKIVSCNRISAYRRRELRIVTDEKKICLNYYCTNYYEAERKAESLC